MELEVGGGFMPIDIFEEYAEDYDRWFDEHREEYLAELARIRNILPVPDSRSIEVGAGSGRFAGPLGIKIGIEPSGRLGRMARDRGIEIIRGRAESLPFRDGSCSSVLLVTVVCFLDDPASSFSELNRVLQSGGPLLIAFIERGGDIYQKYLNEGGKGRFLSRARFYSREEIKKNLRETGFVIEGIDCRLGFCTIFAQKDLL
ncbi:MAG: class I SAM-dependent methyltransferase [Methanolinea sp.]|jgi:SAM-dependent methyltransferase